MTPGRAGACGLIKAVLFDFYGTLARAVRWGSAFEDVFARRGLALDPERWVRSGEAVVFDGQDHAENSVSRDDYVAWELDRLRRRAAACGIAPADVEPLVSELYRESKNFVLEAYPEVPSVLQELRRRGTLVAVCSNWDWDLDQALAGAGLDQLADVVVTSAQAGARKPHPRIFQRTLADCRAAPDEALFVGDTWVPDVQGPLAAGMRAVHVWRNGAPDSHQPPPLVDGVRRARDLRGVLDALDA